MCNHKTSYSQHFDISISRPFYSQLSCDPNSSLISQKYRLWFCDFKSQKLRLYTLLVRHFSMLRRKSWYTNHLRVFRIKILWKNLERRMSPFCKKQRVYGYTGSTMQEVPYFNEEIFVSWLQHKFLDLWRGFPRINRLLGSITSPITHKIGASSGFHGV